MTPGPHPDVHRLVAEPPRSAVVIGQLSDPVVLVTLVLAVISLRVATPLAALGWTVLAGVFCVGIPLMVLLSLVGRGVVLDRHLAIREQRRMPLLAALVSVVLGVGALSLLGAPRPVLALVLAMLAGLLAMTLLSSVYKASMHLAVAAGVGGVLATVYGPWLYLPALTAVLLIGWARLRTGRHTLGEVAAGAVVGWAASVTLFAGLS